MPKEADTSAVLIHLSIKKTHQSKWKSRLSNRQIAALSGASPPRERVSSKSAGAGHIWPLPDVLCESRFVSGLSDHRMICRHSRLCIPDWNQGQQGARGRTRPCSWSYVAVFVLCLVSICQGNRVISTLYSSLVTRYQLKRQTDESVSDIVAEPVQAEC